MLDTDLNIRLMKCVNEKQYHTVIWYLKTLWNEVNQNI